MSALTEKIQNQFHDASVWIENVRTNIYQEVSNNIKKTHDYVTHARASIYSGVSNNVQKAHHYIIVTRNSIYSGVSSKVKKIHDDVINKCDTIYKSCKATAEKIEAFIIRNRANIFFIACGIATAYFAPHLFFPIAIATIIVRVEFDRRAKNWTNENMKTEKDPYKKNPTYGPHYVNSIDLTLAAIAAIDAIALGTLFVAGSWTVALLPLLGGIAAGSCAAKLGMDIAHHFKTKDSKVPPAV
jgi:hypothetical protein